MTEPARDLITPGNFDDDLARVSALAVIRSLAASPLTKA
jgi:hypothetical protein